MHKVIDTPPASDSAAVESTEDVSLTQPTDGVVTEELADAVITTVYELGISQGTRAALERIEQRIDEAAIADAAIVALLRALEKRGIDREILADLDESDQDAVFAAEARIAGVAR